jgi:hypothetical protein
MRNACDDIERRRMKTSLAMVSCVLCRRGDKI